MSMKYQEVAALTAKRDKEMAVKNAAEIGRLEDDVALDVKFQTQ